MHLLASDTSCFVIPRSRTGSNEPVPLCTVFLAPSTTSPGAVEATIHTEPVVPLPKKTTPRKQLAVKKKKKLTPKRQPLQEGSQATSTSPASNTRSKKKLDLA